MLLGRCDRSWCICREKLMRNNTMVVGRHPDANLKSAHDRMPPLVPLNTVRSAWSMSAIALGSFLYRLRLAKVWGASRKNFPSSHSYQACKLGPKCWQVDHQMHVAQTVIKIKIKKRGKQWNGPFVFDWKDWKEKNYYLTLLNSRIPCCMSPVIRIFSARQLDMCLHC
jgi:hypothetical protein